MTFLGYAAIGLVLLYLNTSIEGSILTPGEKVNVKGDWRSALRPDSRIITIILIGIFVLSYILLWPIEYAAIWHRLFNLRKGSQ